MWLSTEWAADRGSVRRSSCKCRRKVERAPEDEEGAVGNTDDDSETTQRPRIDLSPALGEAGHEVEDLGYEGLPDTGAIEETAETIDAEAEAQSVRDLALDRAQFGLPRLRKPEPHRRS
jgi:hypothetical protein